MMEAAQEYNNSGYEKMYPRLVRTWEKFSDRIPPMPDTHQKSADALATDILVYRSASEWKHYKHVGSDPVLHIEVRRLSALRSLVAQQHAPRTSCAASQVG